MSDIKKAVRFKARLEEKQEYNSRFTKYSFELVEPHSLEFQAGQYISIKVSEKGEMRAYSICSSPDIKHGFELLIDYSPNGVGVNYFKQLQLGETSSMITGLGPVGRFVIDEEQDEQEIVLVAAGSGVAPMMSILLDLLQVKQDQRSITLYWGMRTADLLFWLEEFNLLGDTFANFHFYPILSKPTPEWSLSRGRVCDLLLAHEFPPQTGFYLCGGRQMIVDTKQILIDKGVTPQYIHHEHFY